LEIGVLIIFTGDGPTYIYRKQSIWYLPVVGIAATYICRPERFQELDCHQLTASGLEIGLARVYDFALESGSYNTSNSNQNEWDIALYDIQTYTIVDLNEPENNFISSHSH
jgi:hypothetical protein